MPDAEPAAIEEAGFAAHATTDDTDADGDEPLTVHGVALGEGIAHGSNTDGGDPTHYPADVLEAAAAGLEGRKLTDGSNHDDLESQHPPNDAIVGDVTDTEYRPGVGVCFEGEVHREPERSLVENGRMDVSPAVFRSVGEFDDDLGGKPAEEIAHWRDVAVLDSGGSPDATIEPGPAPAAQEALQAEALAATFDADAAHARGRDGTKQGGEEGSAEAMADPDNPDDPTDPEGSGSGSEGDGGDGGEGEGEAAGELASMSKEELVSMVEGLKSEKNDMRETLAELKGQVKALGGDVEAMEAAIGGVEEHAVEAFAEKHDYSEEFVRENFETADLIEEVGGPEATAEALGLNPDPQTGDPDPTSDKGTASLGSDEQAEIEDLATEAETLSGVNDARAEALREQAAALADVDDFETLEAEVL